jgi:inosine-uridine nucleoside N-ribohydrolase
LPKKTSPLGFPLQTYLKKGYTLATPRKIIIDTDPGIDDALAIYYALNSPELDVIGLTTVFGNVDCDQTTVNALRLLEIAGRTDIPVAKGALHPLIGTYRPNSGLVHGLDGQANLNLPLPSNQAVSQSAAEFIIEQVNKAPGEVTLVPIGPLTNLALALRLAPEIAAKVKEVVIMGGNVYSVGNATSAAEANILSDPEAADVVLGAEWPVTLIGLDVTLKVVMPPAQMFEYAESADPLAQHIGKIAPFYRAFYESVYDIQGFCIHDSTTITYLLAPEIFQTKQVPVRVETQGISRGKTWPGPIGDDSPRGLPWYGRPLVNVCVGVDVDRALALERSRVIR